MLGVPAPGRRAAQPTLGLGAARRLGGGRGRNDPPLRRRALGAGSVGHDRFAGRDRRARSGRRLGDRQGQDPAAPVRRRVAGGRDAEARDRESELADIAVLPNGEAWMVGGGTKNSLAGEEIVSHCFIGHHDGADWRYDVDEGCGPLGRVWGAAANDVWADGGERRSLERALPDQGSQAGPREDCRPARHRRRVEARDRVGRGRHRSAGRPAAASAGPRGRPRLLGVGPGRRLGDHERRRADALRRPALVARRRADSRSGVSPRARPTTSGRLDRARCCCTGTAAPGVPGGLPGTAGQYPVAIATAGANDVWVLGEREICASTGAAGAPSPRASR